MPGICRNTEVLHDVRDEDDRHPDDPNQNTSDHGWDIEANLERLKPVVEELKLLDIRVSLFMDAAEGIEQAAKALADRVELYTEPYAAAFCTGSACSQPARSGIVSLSFQH